jgi:heptosyltransferase-3
MSALSGLDVVDRIIELPSEAWCQLADKALPEVKSFTQKLKSESYDHVVNFSYSLFSSYLTHAISRQAQSVFGYTRFSDGSFNPGDPVSQYFYSQVGETKSNRLHLVDLFASTLQVDFVAADFAAPEATWMKQQFDKTNLQMPSQAVVVHVGASQAKKSIFGFQWGRLLKYFLQQNPEQNILLIGSGEEGHVGEEISAHVQSERVHNWVGKTSLTSLFYILKHSQWVVGCDSVMMQIANLTATPCFNLSFETVNFWETGPLAAGSVVFLSNSPEQFSPYQAAQCLSQTLNKQTAQQLIYSSAGVCRFKAPPSEFKDEAWSLLAALYLNENFPTTQQLSFAQCSTVMFEVNELLIQQLKEIKRKPNSATVVKSLEESEKVLSVAAEAHPMSKIIFDWLKGRKVSVAPKAIQAIADEYLQIHQELQSILKIYSLDELKKDLNKKGSSHG